MPAGAEQYSMKIYRQYGVITIFYTFILKYLTQISAGTPATLAKHFYDFPQSLQTILAMTTFFQIISNLAVTVPFGTMQPRH
jgi:glycopeptide antibiotics resistance protein